MSAPHYLSIGITIRIHAPGSKDPAPNPSANNQSEAIQPSPPFQVSLVPATTRAAATAAPAPAPALATKTEQAPSPPGPPPPTTQDLVQRATELHYRNRRKVKPKLWKKRADLELDIRTKTREARKQYWEGMSVVDEMRAEARARQNRGE